MIGRKDEILGWFCEPQFVNKPVGKNIQLKAGVYLFKVNNENTKIMCKICSKLTIKTPNFRFLGKTAPM